MQLGRSDNTVSVVVGAGVGVDIVVVSRDRPQPPPPVLILSWPLARRCGRPDRTEEYGNKTKPTAEQTQRRSRKVDRKENVHALTIHSYPRPGHTLSCFFFYILLSFKAHSCSDYGLFSCDVRCQSYELKMTANNDEEIREVLEWESLFHDLIEDIMGTLRTHVLHIHAIRHTLRLHHNTTQKPT